MFFILLRKFNRTIEILQGDIENLESDKLSLEKKLDLQTKKTMLSDTSVGRRTLGGRGSPYSSPFSSPFGSPFAGRRAPIPGVVGGVSAATGGVVEGAAGESGEMAQQVVIQNPPLLLARVRNMLRLSLSSLFLILSCSKPLVYRCSLRSYLAMWSTFHTFSLCYLHGLECHQMIARN